jgi:hypothetical protein
MKMSTKYTAELGETDDIDTTEAGQHRCRFMLVLMLWCVGTARQ